MEEKIEEQFRGNWDIDYEREKEEETYAYLMGFARLVKEQLYGKEFEEFEYDDPVEEIKKALKELEDEIGEV